MVLSANEARAIIEKVTNDERAKVFEDIANYSKRGLDSIGFLKLSIGLENELKSLGYTISPIEGGVNVSWAIPTTTEEVVPKIDNTTPINEIDKPVYLDNTVNETEVIDDGIA